MRKLLTILCALITSAIFGQDHTYTCNDNTYIKASTDTANSVIHAGIDSITGKLVKKPVTWYNIANKPSTFTPSSHTHTISELTDFPTTTASFVSSTNKNLITDAKLTVLNNTTGINSGDQDLSGYSLTSHTHTFASLTSKPTTLSGFGITDGVINTTTINGQALSSNVTVSTITGNAGTATALQTTRAIYGNNFDGSAALAQIIASTYGGTGNGFTKFAGASASEKTYTLPNASATIASRVAQVDIASTASATSTATIFTPSASGMYRLSIYLKITTTGTSPVAGPVTITYTEPDGSVAQSHVMLLQSVTGTVVTTTVNNSTTTGTVNGSMIFYAKSGVAIQYAIAVSGTFGSGRYMAHITLEAL